MVEWGLIEHDQITNSYRPVPPAVAVSNLNLVWEGMQREGVGSAAIAVDRSTKGGSKAAVAAAAGGGRVGGGVLRGQQVGVRQGRGMRGLGAASFRFV